MTTLSRMRRTLAPRCTEPSVTRQPATLPTFVMLKISRISRIAEEGFAQSGRQQARHRLLDVVHQVVDDVVVTDLDAFALGGGARLAIGADIEAQDHGTRRRGQLHIRFADAADAIMHDAGADLIVADLLQGLDDSLRRTLHVGLDQDREFLAGCLP